MTDETFNPGPNTASWLDRWDDSVMTTYGTPPIVIERGEKSTVWDVDGNEYLDLLSGIAVTSVGHANPAVAKAVADQVSTLIHTSNLYGHKRTIELSERLKGIVESYANTGNNTKVFYCQGGATANEAAIKLARRNAAKVQGTETAGTRVKLISTNKAFHGRTSGSLTLTGKPEKRDQFLPLLDGVVYVDFNDLEQLEAAMDDDVAAIFLEPIQGEGGVNVATDEYLAKARELATKYNALMIHDEVQTGIGRTGEWYYGLSRGVVPDVISSAKGLGGGMPIGASIALGNAADLFEPGDHATTYGGNPVTSAAALAVLDTIENEAILDNVKTVGQYFKVEVLALGHPAIVEVRGAGLLIAIELTEPVAAEAVKLALAKGFLLNAVTPTAIRVAPPLVITPDELDTFVAVLPDILDQVTTNGDLLGNE
ncbi:MAG: acetylornithine transaminase [Candidatus Nanopelagicales bacterium]